MNRSTLTTAAIILCITYGVLSWDIVTHSQEPGPEDSKYAESCSAGSSTTPDMCCIDYNEALNAAKLDWQASLKQLIDQEKAASDMVAEGYESLRTYNCWVEYICRAVEYSGHAPIESAVGTGLRSDQIGTAPGCQDPEDLKMESRYNNYMKNIPIAGLPAEAISNAYVDSKISYFPRCQTGGTNNSNPNLSLANSRYNACKQELEKNFGCPKGTDESKCAEYSTAFVTLENALKTRHGEQKAAALESKLGTILPKMHAMEEHVGYLSNFLEQLDARFECYAGKCS